MKTLLERFSEKIIVTDSCWLWTSNKDKRYGHAVFKVCGKNIKAYRFSYEIHIGKIPEGLTLDHLCRNPSCVNPWHLEPVTAKENILRGEGPCAKKARQTHCKRGHPLNNDEVYRFRTMRICNVCRRIRYKENNYYQKMKEWRASR